MHRLVSVPLAAGFATRQFKPTVIDDGTGDATAVTAQNESRLNGRAG